MTASLPDGTDDADVDAFLNGLDGANLYVDADATVAVNADYYSTTDSRPYTVLEIFNDLYEEINTLETTLSASIAGAAFSASNIPIVDLGTGYDATNVQDALEEIVADVAAFDGTYVPISGGTMTGNLNLAGYRLLFSTAFISAGSGTPEGALTAPIGSLFLRLNGGANTTLYVKESGTGNTGWVAK
jgi:hypothetical protein